MRAPETAAIKVDDYNGRYRVLGPVSRQNKSVSWTQRGWRQTAIECLYWAWRFHGDHKGQACPVDLRKLAEEFDERAVVA